MQPTSPEEDELAQMLRAHRESFWVLAGIVTIAILFLAALPWLVTMDSGGYNKFFTCIFNKGEPTCKPVKKPSIRSFN